MDFPFPESFNESVTKLFIPVKIIGSLALNVSAVSTCVSVGIKQLTPPKVHL